MGKKRRIRADRRVALTAREEAAIDECVDRFVKNEHLFRNAAEGVMLLCMNDPNLKELIHFIKRRVKDPEHLREKLQRIALDDMKAGEKPAINVENLFEKVTDLAGVRILHLYTDQIAEMSKHILAILKEQQYRVDEPVANIWDKEAEVYFKRLGFRTVSHETMYTSLHYDIRLNTVTGVCCELQVRTLADELWGEVSHTIDYPKPTQSIACKEQLKVLARVTSGCTRLVDSIFRSREEFEKQRRTRGKLRKKPST